MKAGKDYLSDKPAMTTLAQLAEVRKVQAETKRIFSVMYSERHENRATVKAGDLVQAGAIGKVIQTVGLGPHREIQGAAGRPDWFYVKEQYGGILTDIASHQFDQFLFFTGSTEAKIVASQVGNLRHPDKPGLEDFGDCMIRGNGGTGYIRVDWFTPKGLATWGDGRLTILGTDGFIEIRKNIDIASGKQGGSHLYLVDQKETRYIDCKDVALPFAGKLIDDVLNRTETSMTQKHTFLAMQLALEAETNAQRLTPGTPATAAVVAGLTRSMNRRQFVESLIAAAALPIDGVRGFTSAPGGAQAPATSVTPPRPAGADALVRTRRQRSGSRRCRSATDASARWCSATSASSACRSTTTRCGRAGRAAGTRRARKAALAEVRRLDAGRRLRGRRQGRATA